jgi:hypothetical protein
MGRAACQAANLVLFDASFMSVECRLMRASCRFVRANGRGQELQQRSTAALVDSGRLERQQGVNEGHFGGRTQTAKSRLLMRTASTANHVKPTPRRAPLAKSFLFPTRWVG